MIALTLICFLLFLSNLLFFIALAEVRKENKNLSETLKSQADIIHNFLKKIEEPRKNVLEFKKIS